MEELTRQIVELVLGLRGPLVYAVVGLFAWAEVAFFLGLFTPGELTIAVAGMLASRGQLELGGVAAAAAAGTTLGNLTAYWLGRRWGPVLRAWEPVQRYLGRSLDSARTFFRERGEWAVSLGAFVSYVRMFVPFLAGDSGMPFRRFLLYGLPAGVVWAVALAVVGFLLGESWRMLQEMAGAAAFLVLALFLLALAIRKAASWIARRRDRIEALGRWLAATRPAVALRRAGNRLRGWLGRRLDPRVARGLSLTLGFLTLLIGAGVVGLVLNQVQEVRGIARLDYPVLDWMSATRTEAAVRVARAGLRTLIVPWFLAPTALLTLVAWWRRGWKSAARLGIGMLGSGLGAYVLDEHVLRAVVPMAEYPSIPVAVAAAFVVHLTAAVGDRQPWGRTVAVSAVGVFFACTVALATVVAGWAAPTGIVLGFALGLTWSTSLELSSRIAEREVER